MSTFSEVVTKLDTANRNEVIDSQWKGAEAFWELNEEMVERKINLEWAVRLFGAIEVLTSKDNEWELETGSIIRLVNNRLTHIFRR